MFLQPQESSAKAECQSVVHQVQRFIGLWDLKGQNISLKEFFVHMATTRTVKEIFAMKILDPALPWTRKMMGALNQCITYFIFLSDTENDPSLRRHMAAFKTLVVNAKVSQCTVEKKVQGELKDVSGVAFYDQLPKPTELKAGVIKMYEDIASFVICKTM